MNRSCYQAAIKLRPDAWSTYSTYSVFLMARRKYEEAEATLRKALELAPDNARLWSNLGVLLYRQERSEEAAAAWNKSDSISVHSAAVSNLALRDMHEGRYAEAAQGFREAIRLRPRDYRTQNNLASVYSFQPGEKARAVEEDRKTYELAEREHQADRVFWLLLSRFWENGKESLGIVQPETVLRWHRKRLASYWTRLSLSSRPGRLGLWRSTGAGPGPGSSG